jgi:hypothetical protein
VIRADGARTLGCRRLRSEPIIGWTASVAIALYRRIALECERKGGAFLLGITLWTGASPYAARAGKLVRVPRLVHHQLP